jgi:hypothetical protein
MKDLQQMYQQCNAKRESLIPPFGVSLESNQVLHSAAAKHERHLVLQVPLDPMSLHIRLPCCFELSKK